MPNTTPLINGKTNWELRLDELKTECDKADRELWPNRFALRSEYNARRASFLQSQITAEQQKQDIEAYAYRTTPSGLLVPVERKDRLPVPSGTLESRPETRRTTRTPEEQREFERSVMRNNGVPYMPSDRNTQPATPAYEYPSWRAPAERPESAAARPYRFQEPVKEDVKYTAPGDEQKFIQRVGMYSNCNVNVQSAPAMRVSIGDFGYSQTNRKKYRMFCEKCKATQQVEAAIVERFNADDPQIKSFCETHRHTVESSLTNEADGRKFRA